MTAVEIPLLRESATFASRLLTAARDFAESRYHFHRRTNWSYRYSEAFYAQEASLFRHAPQAYVRGQVEQPPQVEDVYARALRPRQLILVLLKVAAHTLFRVCGRLADHRVRADGLRIYRKAYVDDIELVFNPREPGVLRAVYPFPISLSRQWRYVRFLHQRGLRFKLAGNPYRTKDLWRLLVRRDVRSLMRLESRAQVLHARHVAALGVQLVQLSDEFDIGSLDFARALAHHAVRVVNSAHGVGKYFPVHAYQEFCVLTQRQTHYYHGVRPCIYVQRQLNDAARTGTPSVAIGPSGDPGVIHLVLLSQTFAGVSEVIAHNEERVVQRLHSEFKSEPRVQLQYKAHPNSSRQTPPTGFQQIANVDAINGRVGTLFVSFFSTCQIDPAFKGHKVLLRGEWIYPEISFDDTETILDDAGLVQWVQAHLVHLNESFTANSPLEVKATLGVGDGL